MEPGTEITPWEDTSLHLVAMDEGAVLGCVLFRPDDARSGRLFQMAVREALQRTGIGSRLVLRLEERLARDGFVEVYAHARRVAERFYRRLGYEAQGEEFQEVGIPHILMRKRLS